MEIPAFAVEIQRGPRERLKVTLDTRGRVEVRIHSLISVTAGVWSPTAEGLRFPMELIPEIVAALTAMDSRRG